MPANWKSAARNGFLWLTALGRSESRKVIGQMFDAAYYRDLNPDVARSGTSPWLHYLLTGFLEGRSPSQEFDNNYYLTQYEDVALAEINPLVHYALFGKREGRSTVPIQNHIHEIQEVGQATGPNVVDQCWPPDRPLISVVIPCFNYGRFVGEAFESVLAQSFADFEVLIVEGGSTDGETRATVAAIERAAHPNVRVLWRPERHLVGDNRNFGIAQARGRYICCLDADDRLKPAFLEAAVFLAEAFAFDIVTPSLECFDGSNMTWRLEDPSFPAIAYKNQIATAALFRKQAWERAGGFRDWGLGGDHIPEDWDFWVRMLASGCRGKSMREPLFSYRVHDRGLTATSKTTLSQQRAAIREANRELLHSATSAPRQIHIEMRNRWGNLLRCAPGGRPVLVALPSLPSQRPTPHGQLIVTTQRDPTPAPSAPYLYRLANLFDPAVWPDFIRYLLARYGVERIVNVREALPSALAERLGVPIETVSNIDVA